MQRGCGDMVLQLAPKVLGVFTIKTASKQPLSKARWIVQSLSIIWYY
jgi:hypothetical protein